MDKRFNFTQARIRDLPTPEKGRLDYSDTDINKLICRVSQTGNKSFLVTKRVDGKLRNITIGKYPIVSVSEARKKAQAILAQLSSGIDPIAEKRKQSVEKLTLEQAFEQYIAERKLKPLTIKGYKYNLKHNFNDWLNKPASKITEKMVLQRHKELSKKGATTANVAMRVLRLTLNYAHAIDAVDSVATDILNKARLWHKNKRKSRVIPSNKLQAWYEAVLTLDNYKAKVYLLMIIYMGFRSSEALQLEWSHVNLKDRNISLHDTKNGTNHTLPIPTVLLPYIKALKGQTGGSKWVFAGGNPERPMWLPKRSIAIVARASGVEFSSHDCRRTFATIAEAVNLPMSMIKRLMNHVTTNDVTGGYIVTEEETLREAITKIADYIQARVTMNNNVVTLTGSKVR